MTTKLTAKDNAHLRELAREAWEAELTAALEDLFERFCEWTEDAMSAFDLTEQIHEFHNGASREIYKRYTAIPAHTAVAQAIAKGILDEETVDPALLEKLLPEVEVFRSLQEEQD